jgi:hypothetical protein
MFPPTHLLQVWWLRLLAVQQPQQLLPRLLQRAQLQSREPPLQRLEETAGVVLWSRGRGWEGGSCSTAAQQLRHGIALVLLASRRQAPASNGPPGGPTWRCPSPQQPPAGRCRHPRPRRPLLSCRPAGGGRAAAGASFSWGRSFQGAGRLRHDGARPAAPARLPLSPGQVTAGPLTSGAPPSRAAGAARPQAASSAQASLGCLGCSASSASLRCALRAAAVRWRSSCSCTCASARCLQTAGVGWGGTGCARGSLQAGHVAGLGNPRGWGVQAGLAGRCRPLEIQGRHTGCAAAGAGLTCAGGLRRQVAQPAAAAAAAWSLPAAA